MMPRTPGRPGAGTRGARTLCIALLLVAAGLAGAATPARAQDPHGDMGGTPPDVPPGDGTIRVEVVHPTDPARTAGLDVALYALAPDGTPGLRSGRTGDDGTVLFEGVSTASDVVYLVGARYREIPFGRRATFEPGSRVLEVQVEVTDPLADTSAIRVAKSEWRLQWLGSELWVHETHTLESSADRVVQVPEGAREGARPAFVGELPEGASGFAPALGSFSQGLVLDGRTLRFWGPVYPGTQEVRYRYRLPLAGDAGGEAIPVAGAWPSGSGRLELWLPESGPEVEVAGVDLDAVELPEPGEREGQPHRVIDLGPLDPGAQLAITVHVPPASHDAERIHIARADVWIDLDDVSAIVSQEVHLAVDDGPRLAGSPEDPLLRFQLPPGAELLGASPNANAIGLGTMDAHAESGLALVGPLPPGETHFGYRYRVPIPDPHAPLTLPLSWPLEVAVANVLVADIGLVVEDPRLHRMRPVRSGTRTYLHREGFQIEPDQTIPLRISRIERTPPPLWASLGGTLALAIVGAAFLLQPLRRSSGAEAPRSPARESAVSRERAEVVESLRDLEHDHETGKVSDADYESMRSELRARALELMERERTGETPSPSRPDTEAAAHCTACGARAEPGWRFCAACGAPLAASPGPGPDPATGRATAAAGEEGIASKGAGEPGA